MEKRYETELPDGGSIIVDPDRTTSTFLTIARPEFAVSLSLFTAGELYSVLAAYFESPDPVEVYTASSEEPIRIVRGEAA